MMYSGMVYAASAPRLRVVTEKEIASDPTLDSPSMADGFDAKSEAQTYGTFCLSFLHLMKKF